MGQLTRLGSQSSGSSIEVHTGGIHSAYRLAAVARYLEKRKHRVFHKKVRYESRKRMADSRPRVRGQFVKQSLGTAAAPDVPAAAVAAPAPPKAAIDAAAVTDASGNNAATEPVVAPIPRKRSAEVALVDTVPPCTAPAKKYSAGHRSSDGASDSTSPPMRRQATATKAPRRSDTTDRGTSRRPNSRRCRRMSRAESSEDGEEEIEEMQEEEEEDEAAHAPVTAGHSGSSSLEAYPPCLVTGPSSGSDCSPAISDDEQDAAAILAAMACSGGGAGGYMQPAGRSRRASPGAMLPGKAAFTSALESSYGRDVFSSRPRRSIAADMPYRCDTTSAYNARPQRVARRYYGQCATSDGEEEDDCEEEEVVPQLWVSSTRRAPPAPSSTARTAAAGGTPCADALAAMPVTIAGHKMVLMVVPSPDSAWGQQLVVVPAPDA